MEDVELMIRTREAIQIAQEDRAFKKTQAYVENRDFVLSFIALIVVIGCQLVVWF